MKKYLPQNVINILAKAGLESELHKRIKPESIRIERQTTALANGNDAADTALERPKNERTYDLLIDLDLHDQWYIGIDEDLANELKAALTTASVPFVFTE